MLERTLVIGLGNPLLGDDGVGWRVADEVEKLIAGRKDVEVEYSAGGGLPLMERMVDYSRAVIVDAINRGKDPTGTVSVLSLEEIENPFAGHLASAHETSLRLALELGRQMGAELPQAVTVVAIESPNVYDFSESLSPPVEQAVRAAVEKVLELLEE